jgi:hypothetical protein
MQQAASTTLAAVLREVKILVEQLLAASSSPIPTIPERQGHISFTTRMGTLSTSARRRS